MNRRDLLAFAAVAATTGAAVAASPAPPAGAEAAPVGPPEPDYPPELLRDFGASVAAARTGVVQWYVAPIPGFEKAGPFALGGLDLWEVDQAWERGETQATPAMLGRPLPGTIHEKTIVPGHAVRFAFTRPENRAWFAAEDGWGRITVAFLGWCGYGFGRTFDGIDAHAAQPERAVFQRYDYAGGHRVYVFQKWDKQANWDRAGPGVLQAADAALAAYLTDPTKEQRYARVWQPVFPAASND